jgi:hypothetical protein
MQYAKEGDQMSKEPWPWTNGLKFISWLRWQLRVSGPSLRRSGSPGNNDPGDSDPSDHIAPDTFARE